MRGRSVPVGASPGWWRHDGAIARLLSPLSVLVAQATARRVARPGWLAPVPVLCCGNASVGGTGKTTLVLDCLARLRTQGIDAHALLRGYGGNARVSRRVMPGDGAGLVGDEALLLAEIAPTWVGGDRAASARLAIAAGAQCLVLDDGLQNPTLRKTLSVLVIDGAQGFGNGRVLPAGPLREPVAKAAARCQAAVLIGEDITQAAAALPDTLPVLRASLVPDARTQALAGKRVFAFAGIGRPGKFYATLAQAGAEVAGTRDFPDHHPFTAAEIAAVLAQAGEALAVTTPKDAVRLPPALRDRILIAGVTLAWETPDGITTLLGRL